MEIVFSVTPEADGGFVAECLSHDIFTQGDNWDHLRKNVQEAQDAAAKALDEAQKRVAGVAQLVKDLDALDAKVK